MIQIRNNRQLKYSLTQQQLRLNNSMLVFNLIRDLMPISRVELARRSPFSPSTISNLVDDLLHNQWIIETSTVQHAQRGRRSIQLEVNAERGYVATVELLGSGYICTIYDICLKKIEGRKVKTRSYGSNDIAGTIYALLKNSRISTCMLIGIHLIYPGIIDPVSGELISSVAIPDEDALDRYLVIQLQRQFRESHVMISTNGTIIAYEEFLTQKEMPKLPLLSVNVDEAIFGGMVASDITNSTTLCYPVEIGHMVVDYQGSACTCGNRGCLETLCTTPRLFELLNEKTDLKLSYTDTFGSEINTANMALIAGKLQEGDPGVAAAIKQYTEILCAGIGSVVNLLNVKSVHLGGDLALLGQPFLDLFRASFYEKVVPLNHIDRVRLELFSSDYEKVRLSATLMCLDAIFRQ